jgi:hypothetical protein
MPISLTCPCGARFEVGDDLAGQSVSCPECRQPVVAGPRPGHPLRTSGFALASVVLALAGAFTGIGTLLAILLGVVGLRQIAKHRDRITGTGYALLGIGLGGVFSILFVLAIIQAELFGLDLVRYGLMGDDVDRSGPLEVARPAEGFAIRRPSAGWGVVRAERARELFPGSHLVLVRVGKEAYIDVSRQQLGPGQGLEEYRDALLETYKQDGDAPAPAGRPARILIVRRKDAFPVTRTHEALEVQFDLHEGPRTSTFLVRLVRPRASDDVFIVRGWTVAPFFSILEPEFNQALDSFRLLSE